MNTVDVGTNIVQIAGLSCIAVLGIGAIVVDGNVGESILVACAAGLGAFVRHIWPTSEVTTNEATQVSK